MVPPMKQPAYQLLNMRAGYRSELARAIGLQSARITPMVALKGARTRRASSPC